MQDNENVIENVIEISEELRKNFDTPIRHLFYQIADLHAINKSQPTYVKMMLDRKTEKHFCFTWIAHELNRLGVKRRTIIPGACLRLSMSFTTQSIFASFNLTGSSIRQNILRSSQRNSFIRTILRHMLF